ncbi:MAG: AMP-binding protein [Acidimicrobiales bacterium]
MSPDTTEVPGDDAETDRSRAVTAVSSDAAGRGGAAGALLASGEALRPWSDHLPDGVDPHTLDLVAGRSLPAAWRACWATDPGRVVIRGAADGQVLTAAALEERSAVAAARFAAAGVGPGDRVAVSAPGSVDFVVAYVGIQRIGAVAVPLNSAYTEREVIQVVADARPVAAITDEAQLARWIEAAAPPGCARTPPDLSGLPTAGTGGVTLDGAATGDPALLCYTSGTTGVPKGVLLSHGNLLASAEAVCLAWRWTPDDELILALPLFHLHGLAVGLHGTLVTGATALVFDRFDPAAVLTAARAGSSMFFGVPTMWHRLARHPAATDLGRLRLGVSGSAPLPVDLHAAIAALAGRPPLERYGMTETVMLVSNPHDGERRAGSVGFPLPGVEVRLAEGGVADDGGDGAPGEIEVRGPNVFAGYWQRPDVNQVSFREGWFRTGDLGAVDPDGYLRIVGRAKELIISGGLNILPREVEEVLRSHPAVDDAAVVGAPDPEWGERVCAFVVPGDPVADSELAAWCAERLAPHKRPRLWRRVDEIPHNALGKIQRDVLVSALAAEAST